ncbi:MAG TPA: DUF418 domain-containing protein, partial [Holophagaceae bacterium]
MDEARPLEPEARDSALDALRGFALFGVLLVNMVSFTGPMERLFPQPGIAATDPVLQTLILLFVQGKFYCLFAFLFGLGFSLQTSHLEARGSDATAVFRQRLLALMAIGLFHGLVLWSGDILFIYACLGLLLLAFRRCRDGSLLVWGLLLLGVTVLEPVLLGPAFRHGPPATPEALVAASRLQAEATQTALFRAIEVYSRGSFAEVWHFRLGELAEGYQVGLTWLAPQILGLFLLGAWSGRRGLLARPDWLSRFLPGAWMLGLACTALYLLGRNPGPAVRGSAWHLATQSCAAAGAPALALAYATSLSRRWAGGADQGIQRWLAPLGRTALTNYLAQSLIGTSFYGAWGTGRYGRVG